MQWLLLQPPKSKVFSIAYSVWRIENQQRTKDKGLMTNDNGQTEYTLKENIIWYLSLLTVVVIACGSLSLCAIFYLSQVPDVTWQRDELTHDRIFLANVKGPAGIGHEARRLSRTISENEVCVTTTIRYYMWKQNRDTKDQNTVYSFIFIRTGANNWQATSNPCL